MRSSSSPPPSWDLALVLLAGMGVFLVLVVIFAGGVEEGSSTPQGGLLPAINLSPVTPPPATDSEGGVITAPAETPLDFVGVQRASSANCNRTVVLGIIHDGQNALNGLRVRVWREGEESERQSLPSGSLPELEDGGYEVFLENRPLSGWWIAAVVNEAGTPLGASVAFQTDEIGCNDGTGRQLIRIDFQRMSGQAGVGGRPLKELSQQVLALELPTPLPAPLSTPPPPSLAWDGVERTLDVPILMYHYISAPPPDADIYRHDLSVGPDVFRAQLVTLHEEGYTTITLAQLAEALNRGTPLPPQPVVLTFDDGYRDNYENAFPILQEEGAVGTFFLITDLVEQNHPLYMSWEQAREMSEAGMEMTSHTTAHAALPELGQEAAWVQISRSRQLLQERLSVPAATFSYPFGKADDGTIALVESSGYAAAVTTAGGVRHQSSERLALTRVRVHGGEFPETLMGQIEYWMER